MSNETMIARPGTLVDAAIQFLHDNPDATTEALGTHIRCAANRVASILEPALLADVIERKEHGATWLWCVGPNADMEQSTAPDEDAREVVKVSAMAAPSIWAYADQRGATAFSTSLSTDGRLTIQRHGRVIAELTDAERREFVKTAIEGVNSPVVEPSTSRPAQAQNEAREQFTQGLVANGSGAHANTSDATAQEIPMADPNNLKRFVDAQEPVYRRVCAELTAGEKTSHWMWFVFPQLRGLGHSEFAQRYGIVSKAEAQAYWQHPTLGKRLQECIELMLAVKGKTALQILGSPDDMKFRSSLTLFAQAVPSEPIFDRALSRFFGGKRDARTLELFPSP